MLIPVLVLKIDGLVCSHECPVEEPHPLLYIRLPSRPHLRGTPPLVRVGSI